MFEKIYNGKKVVITGHTGFKGSWLAIWLKSLGAEVYGFALAPESKEDNFVACQVENFITQEYGDVRDLNLLAGFFQRVQPDIAFHLAAQPLVLKSYQDPVETLSTNLMGTVNFFECVRATSSLRVAINVTSDKCYDNKELSTGYRETDPMGGKDPYSASKGCSELITASYAHSFFNTTASCRIASARAGNVIGGGDWAQNRIVPDFFRSIKEGNKMIIRNPDSTRPWQHVLEPLSGYLHLAAQLYQSNEYSGGWNFGPLAENEYSVRELIERVKKIYGQGDFSSPVLEEKPHEAKLLKLDISKAINQLEWKPVLDFNDTVDFTIDGYRDQLENKNVLQSRQEQIRAYSKKAVNRKIKWSLS